jgi:hypothetical protein
MINCFLTATYCPNGTKIPVLCPAGFYCPRPDVKIECPAGSFCPLGSVTHIGKSLGIMAIIFVD